LAQTILKEMETKNNPNNHDPSTNKLIQKFS